MNTEANITPAVQWLVSGSLLDQEIADQALASATGKQQPVIKYLVDQGILASADIAAAISQQCGFPLLDLDAMDPASLPLQLVDNHLIQKHRVVPLLKRGTTLFLGISDPSITSSLNEIQFHTSCKVEPVVVEESKLQIFVQAILDQSFETLPAHRNSEYPEFITKEFSNIENEQEHQDVSAVNEAPVIRLVNKILMDAIEHGVSDIHLENYEKTARIRFREDGLLREISRPPQQLCRKICSRLKIMAKLDIAEKRLPQDGRFKLSLSRTTSMNFRVNTLPTLWGEKVVLRILDSGNTQLDFDSLGFTPPQKLHYFDALKKQQGLILVTGPTGSGKSMSLYAGLSLLNTEERNIATVEDPVEIHMQGVNQVAINSNIGLDFKETLRAFLRQDPDVLMVGEIRDLETAEIAIKAAQTGHLVLSTLHTNNAPETLSRLLDMGIAPYQLAVSISLIIAQRLVRCLCNRCKKAVELPDKVLIEEGFSSDLLESIELFIPQGCDHCLNGYKGRVGIYEILPITGAISRVIMEGGNSIQVSEIASKAGFNTLRTSALEKAAHGITSLAEVNRITSCTVKVKK